MFSYTSQHICILLHILNTGFSLKSPMTSYDVKNFYKKFVMDPNYHSMRVMSHRKSSNGSDNVEYIEVPDVSTTPFNPLSSTTNAYGPIELYKQDQSLATPIDVYSRKKMLNELSKPPENDSEEMTQYYYAPSSSHEMENMPSFPQKFYEEYEIVHDTPMTYMTQIPRSKPKPHPRPYDWENYNRRPKLKELPPSYVIVGSPVPEPPKPEMPKEMEKEPVKTEEDKISDYEKDYKILPSGINTYLKRKLKFEVDWVTIATILLKFIIFKKIIKFIIILGLLLFVPKYYKWSNTYLNDSVTTTTPPYYYNKWDKFHKYKYPRRKRTTTTSTTTTTTTTSTTTEKNCDTTTTTTTTPPPSTTTSSSTTSSTTHHPYCRHHWCKHNRTTTTTTTTPSYDDYHDYGHSSDDIYVGDDDDDDEIENKDLPEDSEDEEVSEDDVPEEEEEDIEVVERNEYTTSDDEPNFYETFRAVAEAHSFDPQRLADISLFLTQAFEAWSYKSLICYGEEDLHCRFFYLFDIMDRNYHSRSIYNFFKDFWTDWWTRRNAAKAHTN